MNPISNVDRLVLVLRERLAQRARSQGADRAAIRAAPDQAAKPSPLQALLAVEALDDHQVKRVFVQGLLLEAFGQHLVNGAQFQQVVDQVTQTLEEDRAGAGLLNRLVRDLRAGSRAP